MKWRAAGSMETSVLEHFRSCLKLCTIESEKFRAFEPHFENKIN